MNVVYLSPHFPPNYYLFCLNLRKLGANVLGIGDAPYNFLSSELQAILTEYYQVENLENYNEVLRACGYFTHRYGKLDRVDSLNEHWLDTEGRIRTDFNITGPKIEEIANLKSKSFMKKKFKDAGIAVAQGQKINNWKQMMTFVKQIGYPIIAKPDQGVGAADTYKIDNEDQLKQCWSKISSSDYFFEQFIAGDIYSFDGLTDKDGQIVFYTVHRNFDGVMEIVTQDLHTAYYSLREIPEDIALAGKKSIKTFGLSERFFHLEFFRTQEQKLLALELNIRPPGGFTTDMFNYANNIDIYHQWANIIVNNQFTENYNREYHCIFISRKWNKNYRYTHEEVLKKFSPIIVHHSEMPVIFSKAMGNYFYLARSREIDEIMSIKNFVHDEK